MNPDEKAKLNKLVDETAYLAIKTLLGKSSNLTDEQVKQVWQELQNLQKEKDND